MVNFCGFPSSAKNTVIFAESENMSTAKSLKSASQRFHCRQTDAKQVQFIRHGQQWRLTEYGKNSLNRCPSLPQLGRNGVR
jgi:hypothetical protein